MEPTRIYLHSPSGVYRRLLWFHNHRPNEMMMGVYGINGKPAILSHEFPECVLDESQLASVTHRYAEAVSIGQPLDHVTCHVDGRIHLKTRTNNRYVHEVQHVEPLGPRTGRFLHFIVVTDVLVKYSPISGQPKSPNVWFRGDVQQVWSLQGTFSGAEYHLEADVAATIQHLVGGRAFAQELVILRSGTLKGVIWGYPTTLSTEMLANRQTGTMVSFKFPTADSKWLLKTFMFQ